MINDVLVYHYIFQRISFDLAFFLKIVVRRIVCFSNV